MSKLLYLDNAATTKTAPEVVEAMLPYFTEKFGNPSSVYSFAAANKEVINQQRDAIAEMIGAKTNEIYFTGGGSESDNWALKCTAEAYANKGNHIITTKIEHHAILHTAEYLEKRGFEITYLDVDEDGKVKLDDLKAAIRPTTILISVMFANNEIGTLQPIKEIGMIAKDASRGEQCMDLLMVAKYLERIGDHATNVAEWVEYSITNVHPDKN